MHFLNRASEDIEKEDLYQILFEDLKKVELVIEKCITHPLPIISDVCGHLLSSGGKRIRPLLALACAKSYKNDLSSIIPQIAVLEFIHTATLLHDDVVDNSKLRRGKGTANSIWGNSISVLMGDFLFTQAFRLMVDNKNLLVLKLLSETVQKIVEGELYQIQAGSNLDTTIEDWIKIIKFKTAGLFGASCQLGALTIGEKSSFLYEFGVNLGIMFQIIDDVLDYFSNHRGKNQGDDFYNRKITLPVIIAYRKGDENEKNIWEYIFLSQKFSEDNFKNALELLRKHMDSILKLIDFYKNEALRLIQFLPKGIYYDKLLAMIDDLYRNLNSFIK